MLPPMPGDAQIRFHFLASNVHNAVWMIDVLDLNKQHIRNGNRVGMA